MLVKNATIPGILVFADSFSVMTAFVDSSSNESSSDIVCARVRHQRGEVVDIATNLVESITGVVHLPHYSRKKGTSQTFQRYSCSSITSSSLVSRRI